MNLKKEPVDLKGFLSKCLLLLVCCLIIFFIVQQLLHASEAKETSDYQIPRAELFGVIEKIKMSSILHNMEKCPADHVPRQESIFPKNAIQVQKNCIYSLSDCYDQCIKNQPYSCYYLAHAFQENGAIYEAEQLYQRSCELGVASGCTNRGAGIRSVADSSNSSKNTKSCLLRTFQKSCDWNDPWGCTMYAYELIDGLKVSQDYKKVLRVLEGSCTYGESDPACEAAQGLKEHIENISP